MELDCQTCGACCMAPNPGHVPLSGEDYARLTAEEQRERTVWVGNRCFMQVRGDRCVNLEQEAGRFRCTLYERRPTVCRELERGGPACDYQRWRVYEGGEERP